MLSLPEEIDVDLLVEVGLFSGTMFRTKIGAENLWTINETNLLIFN